MRTTVKLDDDLLREARRIALETDRTLSRLIEDALRESILRRRAAVERRPVSLPSFKGGGLMPGVDLDDSAGLLEVMDGPDLLRDPNSRVKG